MRTIHLGHQFHKAYLEMNCDKEFIQKCIDDLTAILQAHDDPVAYWDTLGELGFCYESLYEKQKPVKVKVKSPIVDLKNAFATMTMSPEEVETEILDALANQFTTELDAKVKAFYRTVQQFK
jgi:hypothetical protein